RGMGRNVFQMDDYQSLIRGGHNFSVVSTSKEDITSHYMKADLLYLIDSYSYEFHKDHVKKDGIIVYDSDAIGDGEGIGVPLSSKAKDLKSPDLIKGVGAIAVLFAAIDLDKKMLESTVREEYPKNVEENVSYAMSIYDVANGILDHKFRLESGDLSRPILTGNESIALGAYASGLDLYYAYPMTPSSSILHFLAAHSKDLGITTVHPESEIAVINMALGSAITGVRVMVGSSGGGFALMEEAISLAGMAEVPILCILSSRPGPSTGVPTYTSQGDLGFAIHQGHGEFPKIVASPGSINEAFYLSAELMDLAWKFQTPTILLTEKHLSESSMTVEINPEMAKYAEPIMHEGGEYKRYLDTHDGVSALLIPPSEELIKWSSYEHDEAGITTEKAEIIEKMQDKRRRKRETIEDHLKEMDTVKRFGDEGPLICTYGSTTMSLLEALRYKGIGARVVQPIYLEPFPVWEFERYDGEDVIVVEESAIGQFATLLKEKTGITVSKVVKKYDGRAFDPIELGEDLMEVI
ncbi:MAG: 2-oxoacid:acceptor oxidoreductase family protein, partial [Halobacteriota archaeon]|nr:2-oxoacid:acceptor oxidoreductase family protein [Halobacteriota archaeon]